MSDSYTEIYEIDGKKIKVNHNTGFFSMFWNQVLYPICEPALQVGMEFKYKAFAGVVYGLLAWTQGFFEPEVVQGLFAVPVGLVEGLCIIIVVDFLAGTYRAITDERIKFHPKKWTKTFNKIVFYSIGISGITVGANMFPTALGWLQYVGFLTVTGHEIWSVLKHAKMAALIKVGIELYKKKGDLASIDFNELKKKVDRRSAKDFAEDQAHFFGDEDFEMESKLTEEAA